MKKHNFGKIDREMLDMLSTKNSQMIQKSHKNKTHKSVNMEYFPTYTKYNSYYYPASKRKAQLSDKQIPKLNHKNNHARKVFKKQLSDLSMPSCQAYDVSLQTTAYFILKRIHSINKTTKIY